MNRQEWLKSVKVGDRVRSVKPGCKYEWPGTVVRVEDGTITIYDDESDDTFDYMLPAGCCPGGGQWRIEPLSEWRKDPPDEEGDWWILIPPMTPGQQVDGEMVYVKARKSNQGLILLSAVVTRYGEPALECFYPEGVEKRVRWQKATVPAPPVEVEE